MVHLCGRPIRNRGRCTLGRETAIQPMAWSADGWLRTADGAGVAVLRGRRAGAAGPRLSRSRPSARTSTSRELPLDFQWLRSPWPEELFSLTERPGHLRLYGRETLGSLFRQALVARRQQSHCYSAATVMEFEPEQFQQMAGLVCYYNGSKFHYLYVSHDAELGKHIRVMSCLPDQVQSDVFTRADRHSRRRAGASAGGGGLRAALFRLPDRRARTGAGCPGRSMPASCRTRPAPPGTPNFTGAFVGMCCQDLAGTRRPADFDYFEYRERSYRATIP